MIEINPRTSRSSALASKATGFPIAFISAKLAGGYTLRDIPYYRAGTLDKYTPSGDYVVVKFARWAFEKFREAEDKLGTQMKAVGEVMSIGRITRRRSRSRYARWRSSGTASVSLAISIHFLLMILSFSSMNLRLSGSSSCTKRCARERALTSYTTRPR